MFALAESAPEFVALARLDNQVVYVNPAGRALVGIDSLDEARSHPIADYLTEAAWKASLEIEQPAVVADGKWHGRSELRHFTTGEAIPVEITSFVVRDQAGAPILLATFQRDIRGELVLEERVRSAEKLEAVGRLAGSVAHDFNNLLMVILGYGQLLADGSFGRPEAVERYADEILKAATQGSEITARLLALARHDEQAREAIDVNAVVADNVPLLHHLAGEDVECVVRLAAGPAFAKIDGTQVVQTLLNLCANARDAQPNGGLIEIAIDFRQGPVGEALGDRNVVISVRDRGVGIPPESLARVLEPFFTTKGETGGTGLGLASVAAIARAAGGDVLVESELGVGTTVSVVFPEVGGGPEGEAARAAPSLALAGSERILFVEDDPAVAHVVRLALEAQGYDVEHIADGGEALRRLSERAPPDLLVADIGIPGLRGDRLAGAVRERWPALPILLVSGQEWSEGSGAFDFMAKPFLPTHLIHRIRLLLDGG